MLKLTVEETLKLAKKHMATQPCILCGALPSVNASYLYADQVGIQSDDPRDKNVAFVFFVCSACQPYGEHEEPLVLAQVEAKMRSVIHKNTWDPGEA